MIVPVGQALVGLALLVRGYRLFWFFVGVIGFVAGLHVSQVLFEWQPRWVQLLAGLACGGVGILLAVGVQHIAVAIAGFLAGGTILWHLAALLEYAPGPPIVVAGGIAGAVTFILLFDWALIVLSSAIGAGLILDAVSWPSTYAIVSYGLLTLVGIVAQSVSRMRSRNLSP